ncbi:MAG: hypothetical protein AABZ74_03165 [Cyanobacteriota bacterium]
MKIKNLSSLLLSSLVICSCSQPTAITLRDNSETKNPVVSDTSTTPSSTDKAKEEALVTNNVQLTQKINGIDNPIGPENIESVEVAGKIINVSDIKIVKSTFSTKADTNTLGLEYLGNGNFKLSSNSELSKLNSLVLKFNLLNSKNPLILPLLKGFADNIRASYDPSTGNLFGGTLNKDGLIDKNKPVFSSDGNKFTIQEAEGKESVFDTGILVKSQELPKPEQEKSLSLEAKSESYKKVENNTKPVNSFSSYVGLWVFSGFGQKIVVNVTDLGKGAFSAKTKIDKEYSANGDYAEGAESITAKASGLVFDLKLVGNNQLKLTLKESKIKQVASFNGISVNLDRVNRE